MEEITVFLDSDEYGKEEFTAENMKEAIQIIRRLRKSSIEAYRLDNVERRIGIIVGDAYNGMEEPEDEL